MEPRLEDFPQFVPTSAELIQRPENDPAGDKNIEAGQRGLISPSLSAETKAALVRRAEVWRDGLIAKGLATGGREVSQAHSGEKSTGAGWEEVRPQELASEETEVVADEHVTRRSDLPASLTNADTVASEPGALKLELTGETIVAGRRQGDFPMDAKQGESRKERVGRLLGVAAVLLAIAGLFGLPAFFRSPQDPIQSAGPLRVRNDRIVSSTPSAREKGLQEQGQGQTQTYSTQPVEQTPDTGTVSGKERATRERLATRPITLAKAETPGNEARSPERKVRSPEKQRGAVARSTPVLGGRIADGRIPDGRIPDGGGGVSPREPGARLPAGDRLAPAGGTPLIVDPSGMDRKLISARAPVYPPEAIREHIEGKVVLNAFIAKDGTVRRMDVVEGSKVFTKSALAAVSWRRYRPYLVRGRPVEVQTQITVSYPGTEKKIRAPL